MPIACSRRSFLGGVAATLVALEARAQAPGVRTLEARAGLLRLLPEPAAPTDVWGFDGWSPGPLLRLRQGDELAVRLFNRLEKPLSLHWQGMRGDNAMDGVAPLVQSAVPPGGEFLYRRKAADAGLFCYRPSVFGSTPELMARGLKGLLVVDEPEPPEADVDLVMALDDWRLDKDGKVEGDFDAHAAAAGQGRIGPIVAVDGKPAPSIREFSPGARVRLRLANLANARIMFIAFDNAQPFVVAVDSQPCDAFEPVRRTIPAAPGARFELMFDLPREEGARCRLILRSLAEPDRELVAFVSKGPAAPARGPIVAARQNPLLPPAIRLETAKKLDLVLEPPKAPGGRWSINGAPSKAYEGPALLKVKRGTPITFGFVNRADSAVVMHVHGHAARLLHDLDDGWEPYWRNGVVVPPGKTKHIAFIADSPGKWAVHDDILEHEAAGLAGWFEVE
ncbi:MULTISPECIES: multicopper oxidase family protein [Methylosinus]|uniref:Copper oxidase n=1 Tax=Methylosinus trichosporium (strain ATCC 35070 / NCIMB 11131 / UNIQEM 75 / OB3b) TaxID=595536 RepID=A0A2D2D4W1_METT3|nr:MULTISPECIES: multicopper oxidase family protein [Methylosinus]ATQ70057.1 copper oxidase [Methylosinus trichosporium OB3b]OBS54410.1 copper oxidase [Methylosinus sp. 3S-1]